MQFLIFYFSLFLLLYVTLCPYSVYGNNPTETPPTNHPLTTEASVDVRTNSNPNTEITKLDTITYIAPGEKLELFDPPRTTTAYISFDKAYGYEDHLTLVTDLAELENKLSLLAYQKNIVYAGNLEREGLGSQGLGLVLRADDIYTSARETSSTLSKIRAMIEHLELYYRTDEVPEIEEGCLLKIPSPNITALVLRANDLIRTENTQNAAVNNNLVKAGNSITVKNNGNNPAMGIAEIGNALLYSEIALQQIEKIMKNTYRELNKRQEMIESLINKEVPAPVLAGLDIKLGCIEKGTKDHIHVEQCYQGPGQILCRTALLNEGKGVITNRIVSIPYHQNSRTLRLHFNNQITYKSGTGKTYDISNCEIMGQQAKCPNLIMEANGCLENILEGRKELHPDCRVEEVPEARPLIQRTALGTLIAQQSDTPLVAEHRGKSITQDPFIMSNSGVLEILFGSEEIKIPGLDLGQDILTTPKGSFDALNRAMEVHNWRAKWERFLPLHQRQILLLFSLSLQLLLSIPAIMSVIDTFMSYCGYEVIPRAQRRNLRRYRTRNREIDLEAGEEGRYEGEEEPAIRSILLAPRRELPRSRLSTPSRSASNLSDMSRMRLQNMRAMGLDTP